jgi:hypothetical protein
MQKRTLGSVRREKHKPFGARCLRQKCPAKISALLAYQYL